MLAHVRKMYPSLEWDENDFAFQEQLRIYDAKAYTQKREEVVTGQHALSQLRSFFPITQELTPAFRVFIQKELEAAPKDGKTNVRGLIKRIWMYPASTYAPFQELKCARIDTINNILKDISPRIALSEGKVYAFLPGVVEKIWKVIDLAALLPEFTLRMNTETPHLTLVNSDIVCKLDAKDLEAFLREETRISLTCTGLAYTISLDWPLFSTCIVAKISSPTLDTWISKMNMRFRLALKPSYHLTLAICPRG